MQEAIDTLLNFAPLTELATALGAADFSDANKKDLRAVLAERYLAQENFAEAKKIMPAEQFKLEAEKLERLTAATTGAAPEKASEMAQLGDAWAEARGKLLRAPLGTRVGLIPHSSLLSGLARRANGRSLQFQEVDNELEQRDELRHAARWWLAAASARPGTPLAAQARWKALETMPKIARASEYAEERARESKAEAVSREIYATLRKESPDSVEAKRRAAYWSFPAASESSAEWDVYFALRDAHIMGYPFSDYGGFGSQNGADNSDEPGLDFELLKPVALLPEKAMNAEPAEFASVVRQLDETARKAITSIRDATVINFLDDLAQLSSEPNLTREMLGTYCAIRFMVLQSNGWNDPSGQADSPANRDDEIRAKIDEALKNPALQSIADYFEFSRIGLIAGDRTELETDIVDPKGDGAKVTVRSRDYAAMEKMARAFLQKYPRSRKREAALFVVARSVQALSRPYLCEIGVPAPGTTSADGVFDPVQKSYQAEPFDPKRVLSALDDYDQAFPNGRYAAEVRNLRGMTLWRMHDWGKALDLTVAQLDDASKRDLQPEASVRLANIFAALEQPEHRADVLEAVRARPAAIKYLKSFLGRASNDREHPLRYLQAYLSDQLNLKAVAQN